MRKTPTRKTLIGVAATMVWLSTVSTGAHALLGSQASLTGNRIIVGSADLLISNSQAGSSTTYDTSREGFAFNLAPGQSAEKYFLLKNTSSADVAMAIKTSASIGGDEGNIAPFLTLEFVPVDSEGVMVDGATPARSTLSLLANRDNQPMMLGSSINKGEYQRYKLRATLDAQYSNEVQDVTYNLIFDGVQVTG